MKAAVYYNLNDIRYEEVARPEIGRGEVLLKVRSCGLCGTDISKMVQMLVTPPAILGHEVAGDVEEVGDGVEKFHPGDRVFAAHHVPCFVCHWCRHGNYSLCPEFRRTNIDPGGFAEYIRIPHINVARAMFRIPDELSYEEASLIESTACCLRAILKCRIQPADTVVVVGCGPMGLLHLKLALLLGAGQVIASDLVNYRRMVAEKFGAGCSINPQAENVRGKVMELTSGRGADLAIVAVGNPQAISQAMSLVREGGTVSLFAECPGGSKLTVDPNLIYHEVNLIGSYSSTPSEQRIAFELIRSGRLKLKGLITHRFKLEQLGEAVKLARQQKESLKIVITAW
ncbi:zinc-dependent dehydrogenase [bacterium]|nr:zinc-dependent dehydrogenase [bacterium]